MDIAAVIISILALLFTVFSYWWLYARKGKLHVSKPRGYRGIGSQTEPLKLQFPFTFYNDGPTPIIIENLRLIIGGQQGKPLYFNATLKNIGSDEGTAYATQFAVAGREAREIVCEFRRRPGELVFVASKYPMKLEALLDDKQTWEEICDFALNVTAKDASTINSQFLVYDNMTELLPLDT